MEGRRKVLESNQRPYCPLLVYGVCLDNMEVRERYLSTVREQMRLYRNRMTP